MINTVADLRHAIMESVVIPPELANNMAYKTTGLGGLFLDYRSDNRGGVHSLNSNVSFTIYFDIQDNYGKFAGTDLGIEMTTYRNIKPIRSIKKKKTFDTVINKVNEWLEANKMYLYNSIQN